MSWWLLFLHGEPLNGSKEPWMGLWLFVSDTDGLHQSQNPLDPSLMMSALSFFALEMDRELAFCSRNTYLWVRKQTGSSSLEAFCSLVVLIGLCLCNSAITRLQAFWSCGNGRSMELMPPLSPLWRLVYGEGPYGQHSVVHCSPTVKS